MRREEDRGVGERTEERGVEKRSREDSDEPFRFQELTCIPNYCFRFQGLACIPWKKAMRGDERRRDERRGEEKR
jgi:hypothetical protein